MERSYEFYKKRYNFNKERVNSLYKVLIDLEQGIVNEDFIRNNGVELLNMCVCENRIDLFKKLISPFPFKTGEKEKNPLTMVVSDRIRYHYLIDYYSIENELDYFPSSIMEAYVNALRTQKYNKALGLDQEDVTLESVSKDIVLLSKFQREDIKNTLVRVNPKELRSMRVRDVLARQISGMSHPILNEEDVFKYSESTTYLASLILFRKNIRTLANDTGGCYNDGIDSNNKELFETNIYIDYKSLSEMNKLYFNLLVEKGFAKFTDGKDGLNACIYVMASPNDDASRVIDELIHVANSFDKQDVLYGRMSAEQLWDYIYQIAQRQKRENELQTYLINGIDSYELQDLARKYGFNVSYDEGLDEYFEYPEYQEKHKEFVNYKKLCK